MFSDVDNAQIGNPSGDFQKFSIRFNKSEYAQNFLKAYENGVNDQARFETIYIQPDMQAAIQLDIQPESVIKLTGTTPESSSASEAFSFGDKPAKLPIFAGLSVPASNNDINGFKFESSNPKPLNFDSATSSPFTETIIKDQ